MSKHHRFGARWSCFGSLVRVCLTPITRAFFALGGMHAVESKAAARQFDTFRERLDSGETVYVVGFGPAGNNSGVALLEVSRAGGMRLIGNDEEERFSGVKHCEEFPEHAFRELEKRLGARGLNPSDVHAYVSTFDYAALPPLALSTIASEFPASWQLFHPQASPSWDFHRNVSGGRRSPERIRKLFSLQKRPDVIGMPHHENHAAFAYALSPFAAAGEKTAIAVLDGFGDEGAISLFVGEDGKLTKLRANYSLCDSLGAFYSIISSTQGGWTILSSEGRYMGAAAWGDNSRLTNSFYRSLREILHLGPDGEVQINRSLARWHLSGELHPYQPALKKMIGEPIPHDRMWNPDAVLNVNEVEHSEITQRRVDLAAATQLVFEDALFHIVEHLIRTTGASRLVISGGTALNCLGNMKLIDHFDEEWFRRQMNRDDRLKIWIPPAPGDAGVTIGAAYAFALRAGVKPDGVLPHAFHCGIAPSEAEISEALSAAPDIGIVATSEDGSPCPVEELADLMAWIIQQNGVLGLFHGAAETGPRALGHRSILANACRHNTLELINARVKYRERIRPLAPMVTREAAEQLFELSDGAAADDYNAYNYMALTVRARPKAKSVIPAVIHKDGTARIQIVRPDSNPLCHAVLKALGRRIGTEAMVNTSLNVGGPIVQTPVQALETLRRARAMTGLVMISDENTSRIAYHNVNESPKDGGHQLIQWVNEFREQSRSVRIS